MRENIPYSKQHRAILDTDGTIECPICSAGDGYLHPVKFRTEEDYMEADFYCEHHTDRLMTLRMNFHKGKTYMYWLKNNNNILETKENYIAMFQPSEDSSLQF